MNKYIVVIPAYEPNNSLNDLIDNINHVFESVSIVVVDDGSQNKSIFEQISSFDNVTILKHETNKGKGAALKTAFKYLKEQNLVDNIIISADADGQHRPNDILKVAKYHESIGKGIVLGSRVLDKSVPLRSRFGNDATRFIYRIFYRRKIYDNQTGLRAFNQDLLDFMLSIKGERYEYEMNVLMECPRQNIDVNEIQIETVYLDNNSSSHFRPVKDFLKICHNMLKYGIPTFISLCFNILFFIVFYNIFSNTDLNHYLVILFTCISSSILTVIINFIINRLGILFGNHYIFKIPKLKKKYYILGSIATLVHIVSIFAFYFLIEDVVASKVFGDIDFCVLFLAVHYLFVPNVKLK